jgi:hypothetical protein
VKFADLLRQLEVKSRPKTQETIPERIHKEILSKIEGGLIRKGFAKPQQILNIRINSETTGINRRSFWLYSAQAEIPNQSWMQQSCEGSSWKC